MIDEKQTRLRGQATKKFRRNALPTLGKISGMYFWFKRQGTVLWLSKIEQKFHINIWRVGCRGDSRIARETSRKTNSNRVGRERGCPVDTSANEMNRSAVWAGRRVMLAPAVPGYNWFCAVLRDDERHRPLQVFIKFYGIACRQSGDGSLIGKNPL